MIKDLLKKLWKKKSSNPYPKSFGKRLTRRILLRMILFLGIPAFILFWISFGATQVAFELLGRRMLKGQYEEVRRMTSDVCIAAVNTAPFIEDNLDKPDKMYDIMEGMLRTNIHIRSCGLSFVADYYPQKGHWFCPYAVRRDSTTIECMTIGSKDHDYLQEEWFQKAVSKDSSCWSKPFFENIDKETPLVAYLVPIHDRQQRLVAILGVDMSLNWFSDQFKAFKSEDENEFLPYYFVIDSTGTFLSHPKQERIIHKKLQDYVTNDPDQVCQQLIKSRDDETNDNELSLENMEYSITTHPVKYTAWTVGLAFPTILIEVVSYIFGGFMLFFIVIGVLVVLISGRNAIRKATFPIRLLALSADDVAKGNFQTPLPELNSRDEIHQLRDSFQKMQQSLSQYTEQLTKTTAEKAHTIQMSMLPKTFPPYPERNDVDIYGQVMPAKAVGGDLFDFYIRDEKLFFCIGDVSGKGVPASMFMAVARSLFRNISAHVPEPHIIAKALNDSMSEGNEMNITVQETTIVPQTTIFLFTDGLNEAENVHHQQFGDEQVLSMAKELLENGESQPMPFVQRMAAAVHFFAGAAEQSDDLTMLAIQYKKEGE